MKKLLAFLCVVLLFTACGGPTTEPSNPGTDPGPVAPVAPITPPSSGETPGKPETDQPPQGSNVKTVTTDYRYGMDSYEDMVIVFLGCMTEERNLNDIMDRAINDLGFSLVSEITSSDIVYGLCNGFANNVYLIIPAWDTDIRIGRYSWYANEIVEDWYNVENSDPIIFVEMAEEMNYLSRLEYKRHFDDGDTDGWMYLGFDTTESKLRTAFHMGIVDNTPYDYFDTTEIGFYQQYFFDSLCQVAEVQSAINKGAQLNTMGEAVYDGDVYAIYNLSDGSKNTLFGIHVDLQTGARTMIKSDNGSDWSTIGFG